MTLPWCSNKKGWPSNNILNFTDGHPSEAPAAPFVIRKGNTSDNISIGSISHFYEFLPIYDLRLTIICTRINTISTLQKLYIYISILDIFPFIAVSLLIPYSLMYFKMNYRCIIIGLKLNSFAIHAMISIYRHTWDTFYDIEIESMLVSIRLGRISNITKISGVILYLWAFLSGYHIVRCTTYFNGTNFRVEKFSRGI